MDGRGDELPDLSAVEQDFSIPADADYRDPADPDEGNLPRGAEQTHESATRVTPIEKD